MTDGLNYSSSNALWRTKNVAANRLKTRRFGRKNAGAPVLEVPA